LIAAGSVLPAVLAAAWVLAAMPLVVFHIYRPLPATLLGLVVAVLLGRPALRVARTRAASFGAVPWWVPCAVLAVVVGFGVLAFATSAHDVVIRRDPGSYAMSAVWLAAHGTIQIPAHAAVFGGPDPNLVLASQGFYLQGSHIIPQFMTGVPVLLAIGGWANGVFGVLHMNAFIGALALLAFAGLAARLVGVRLAPLAVLALALVQPQLIVMRATYSEPAAQLLLLGGIALLLDAVRAGRLRPVRAPDVDRAGGDPRADADPAGSRDCRLGLRVAGLVLGVVSVVRIDAIADLLPIVPFLGWLAFHRQRAWRWLAAGTAAGLLVGVFDAVFLTLPYAKHVGGDLYEALAGFALVIPLTVIAVRAGWASRRPHPPREAARMAEVGLFVGLGLAIAVGLLAPGGTKVAVIAGLAVTAVVVTAWALTRAVWWGQQHADRRRSRHWSALAALGVFALGLFFFLRPHLMTMRSDPRSGGAVYTAQVQAIQGLPIDPTRSYYENATRWMSWYLGWIALALALAGAMWLAYQLVAGRRRDWLPAFAVFLGMTAAVLAIPSITPDHPWADRRFVPVAYPGVILFAFLAVAVAGEWLASRAQRDGTPASGHAVRGAVAVLAAAVIVVPAWWGSRHVFTTQTELGEVALVNQICAQLRPNDAVLAFGAAGSTVWPGTLRVMCGVSTGHLDGRDDAAALARIAERVQARGGRLMIFVDGTVAGDRAKVPGVVDWPAQVTGALRTTEVGHTLLKRPDTVSHLTFEIWLGQLVRAPAAG
jgi:hypothetical protein